MANRFDISWPRIFAEGTAIVVSILLAFGIQAWWDNEQEENEEREVLRLLVDDVRARRDHLERERTYIVAIKASVEKLLDLALQSDPATSPDNVDALLGDMIWFTQGSYWTTGSLHALTVSGDIGFLSSLNLRNKLGELWVAFDAARQYQDLDRTFVYERQRPYLSIHAFRPQLEKTSWKAPGVPEWSYPVPDALVLEDHFDHFEILRNREFQNLLVERRNILGNVLQYAFQDLDR